MSMGALLLLDQLTSFHLSSLIKLLLVNSFFSFY